MTANTISEVIKTETPKHPPKQFEMILTRVGSQFVVKSVKNSARAIPGETMDRKRAQEYCDAPGWTVTIVDNDILDKLLSLGSKIIP